MSTVSCGDVVCDANKSNLLHFASLVCTMQFTEQAYGVPLPPVPAT